MADFQYTYNGFTFGDGQNGITITEILGVDMPDVDSHDTPRADGWGAFAGLDSYGERTMLFAGELEAVDATEMEIRSNLLRRATNIITGAELPLVIDLAGQVAKRIDCRPRRRRVPINHQWAVAPKARIAVEFRATDPRFYADAADTTVIAIAGTGAVPNTGDVETKWVATITGPVTNPKLTHVGTGQFLDFSANGGLVVPSGQTLIIRSREATARLNVTTNALTKRTATSEFFQVAAGGASITFTATAGTGSCSIESRAAWGALT